MTQNTQHAPANPETLTLDSAMGLLSGRSQDEDKERLPSGAATRTDDSGPIAFDDWLKQNPIAASSEESDQVPSDAADGESSEDEPTVKPPASWTAEDQALFRSLPPEIQHRVAAREQQRERVINEVLRDQAAIRRAEAQRATIEQEQQHAQLQLEAMIPAIHQELGTEFADVRSAADEVALAQKDPARYAVLKAKQSALTQALVRRQQAQVQAAQQQMARTQATQARERAALIEKRPDLRDKAAADKFGRELQHYLVSQGFPPNALAGNVSHLDLLLVEKAMLYDRAQKARAAGMARPVPRVQSPGTTETRGERTAGERANRFKRLEKSGRIEDAVGLLRL